jgi:hypothetical protein
MPHHYGLIAQSLLVKPDAESVALNMTPDIAMVGILVHGDNHFIVRGPLPDREIALALVRHWSLIQVGATTPSALDQWRIVSREFRENLGWAIVVPGDGETSPAVTKLLEELSARGLTIHNSQRGRW